MPKGYKVANIHLFGIKYADIIVDFNYKSNEIIKASGINSSYGSELSKGIKLARYVIIKE